MKIKTSELSGAALDWAVAKCEGRDMYAERVKSGKPAIWFRDSGTHKDGFNTDYGGWTICGPIIEREKISPYYMPGEVGGAWRAELLGKFPSAGSTPLVAAMRCYVASKLGNEVEVPEELV